MTTALVALAPTLDTLYTAGLLCALCDARPWTQPAQWHLDVLLCADCALDEPMPIAEE